MEDSELRDEFQKIHSRLDDMQGSIANATSRVDGIQGSVDGLRTLLNSTCDRVTALEKSS